MVDVCVWNVNKLTEYGPKWNSANYRLKPCNDYVGAIKRSGGKCKEDQY